MPKTPKRTRAKVIEKPSRKQAAKRKEQIAMPENTTGQQPPQPPPQVATQAPIESKAKGQTPIPSEKSSLLDEWAKDRQKWLGIVEDKDLKNLATKIVPHIDVSPKGVIIAETQKAFLGTLLFNTIFQLNTGMLEDYRMIAPNYRTTHPNYDAMRINWESFKMALPEVHPSVKGVMDWKVITRKLKTFARLEAIKMLAADKAKDLTEPILMELQRERYDTAVIKYCITKIHEKGIKDGKTVADLRKETSARLKREKRLQRAEKTNDMAEALTKLFFKLNCLMFSEYLGPRYKLFRL